MIKLLTFSTLYPSSERPNHGVFVETRLRHLLASGKVQSRVVAPVPWFPLTTARFGDYSQFARTPREETHNGVQVLHPRYLLIPKIGMTVAPFLLAAAMIPVLRQIIRDGYDFDVIDAHYFYPDGVAAIMLGRYFRKPVTITARGSDISLIPNYTLPRRMILWAARRAAGLITVCRALKDAMVKLGVDAHRILPLRNGVDLNLFQPVDREKHREALGLKQFTLLSVGYLVERKGHGLAIQALVSMPDVELLIAGTGPDRGHLENLAKQLGVQNRVRLLGAIPHAELRYYYGAADALVLASAREGWANVLLESMACGTPVIASNVWGTPEVVEAPDAGLLMQERTASGIVQAVSNLRAHYPDRAATRRYAERFSWDATTQGQLDLFQKILREARP